MKRIVTGPRAVLEALRGRGAQAIHVVYVEQDERKPLSEVAGEARARRVAVEVRDREELDRVAGDVRHQGVVAITGEYRYHELEEIIEQASEPALIVALDEVTDPHNFGAIIRSAVAFGATGLVTLKHRAAPVTPVVVRASAGATEHARIARVANLSRALETLHDAGFQVVGLAGEGDLAIDSLPGPGRRRVLVVGSEGKGLRRLVREHCDLLARIPMAGPIASLNASVAAGIALYALSKG